MHSLVDVLGEFFQSFRGDWCPTHRANRILLNPSLDTLRMEVMSNVAWERRHLVIRSKLHHADCAIFVLFEIIFVVFHLDHTIKHFELLASIFTRLSHRFFDKCEDAWQATNTNQKQNWHENSWQYCCTQNHQPINEVPQVPSLRASVTASKITPQYLTPIEESCPSDHSDCKIRNTHYHDTSLHKFSKTSDIIVRTLLDKVEENKSRSK